MAAHTESEHGEDHRSTQRRPLGIFVKSRMNSREIFVDVLDISETGCKLRASSGFAEVGDRVTMKVGGVHAPVGRIAWVDDRRAGVTFEGEIHAAVLDHLCSANGAIPKKR